MFPVGTSLPDADIAAGLITVEGVATDAVAVTTPATRTLVITAPAGMADVAAGVVNIIDVVIAVGADVRNPGTLPTTTPTLTVDGSHAGGATASAVYATPITTSAAATIQVDDNLVAAGSAFATIQAAHDVALAGDTINVAAGAYPADIDIITATLTIVGAGTATTTITGQSTDPIASFNAPVDAAVDIQADNVKLSGFTINAPGGTAALFATAILVSGIDVEIFNNALTLSKGGVGGTPSVGIYTIVANAFDGLSIHDNTIGDDGSGSGLGFQGIRITAQANAVITAKPVVVTDNVITGAVVRGIESERASVTIGGSGNAVRTSLGFVDSFAGINVTGGTFVIVQENTIQDAGMGVFSSGILIAGSANGVVVRNNTVTGSLIGLFATAGAHTVTGNVFENNGDSGITLNPGAVGSTFTNNFIDGNDVGILDISGGVNTFNFNSITANPTAGIASANAGTLVNPENNWWGNAGGPGVGGANTTVAVGPSTIATTPHLSTLGIAGPAAGIVPVPWTSPRRCSITSRPSPRAADSRCSSRTPFPGCRRTRCPSGPRPS